MKKIVALQIFSLVLIIAGLFGVLPTMYFRYKLAAVNAVPIPPVLAMPSTEQITTKQIVSGNPVLLSVDGTTIQRLQVVPGEYNAATKLWNIGLNTAHFATITSPANDTEGNTYIYGHNRREVFSSLHTAAIGAVAEVITDNGYRFTYKLTEVKTLAPNDTSIFAYTGKPILTLQTCSGLWFEKRQQFTFDFVAFEKI